MEGSLLGAVAAAGLFLLFQCCGAAVAWAALPGESGGVRLLLGSVCGTVMLQWFPVPFAFLLGFTLPAHGCAAALALLCAGLCLRAGRRKGLPTLRLTQALLAFRRRKGLWLALGLWLFACWLVCRSFRWEEGAVYSSQATYGDMSMHLSFITSLANQRDFPPDYSLLPGTRLSYPFLSDSISASLYQLGAPLWFAYALHPDCRASILSKQVALSDHGIVCTFDDERTETIAWNRVTDVLYTPREIVFYLSKYVFFILPCDSFESTDDLECFIKKINTSIRRK